MYIYLSHLTRYIAHTDKGTSF